MIKEGSTDLRRQRRQSLCRICKLNVSRDQQGMAWSAEENRFKLLVLWWARNLSNMIDINLLFHNTALQWSTEWPNKNLEDHHLVTNVVSRGVLKVVGCYIWVSEWSSLKSCPTLCKLMDGSLPGPPVHEILQVKILEWVAISFSMLHMGPTQRNTTRGRTLETWEHRSMGKEVWLFPHKEP